MRIEASLLEILVCPACRAEVRPDEAAEELVCQGCGLAYPVRDDIPVMLVDEARKPAPPKRREPTPGDPPRGQPGPSPAAGTDTPPDAASAGPLSPSGDRD